MAARSDLATYALLTCLVVPFAVPIWLRLRDRRRQIRTAARIPHVTDFESQTVEEFLRRAFIPSFEFGAREWADGDEPETAIGRMEERHARRRKGRKTVSTLPEKFDPPVARIHCTGCLNNWDAWVNDDGTLQDPRDAHCACDKGGFVTLTDED